MHVWGWQKTPKSSPGVSFQKNVITQEPLGLESSFYVQMMQNGHVFICSKRTFCCKSFSFGVILKKLYFNSIKGFKVSSSLDFGKSFLFLLIFLIKAV